MKSENELKVNDELIAKYLSGEATPEEAIALNDWLETPGNKAHFEGLVSAWNAANPAKAIKSVNRDEAWEKVSPQTGLHGRPTYLVVWRTVGIAASVLLVAFIITQLFFGPASFGPLATKIETGDSTRQVVLADQSMVTLYRHSEIIFAEEFDSIRLVSLVKGEAFFAVEKNESKPFVVHTDVANIRVVGTEFNVVVNNDEVTVAVNEGVVLVYTLKDSIYLQKGSAATIKTSQSPTTANLDSNAWAYASRKLVFKDTPMNDVIAAVEKTYGSSIRISNDHVKNCKLTATFDNDSVENIVLLIAETLNLKLEKNGQVFILDGEGCP